MTLLTTIAAFLVTLGILVVIHEYGHYWVAKKAGVKVLRFSIGFGRPIARWVRGPDRTEWVVSVLPLGGYVRMLDERDPNVCRSRRPICRARSIASPYSSALRSCSRARSPICCWQLRCTGASALSASSNRARWWGRRLRRPRQRVRDCWRATPYSTLQATRCVPGVSFGGCCYSERFRSSPSSLRSRAGSSPARAAYASADCECARGSRWRSRGKARLCSVQRSDSDWPGNRSESGCGGGVADRRPRRLGQW